MPRFSASLTFLFSEYAFLDRFKIAAEAGFKYVEYMFPYDYPKELLARKLEEHNLTQVVINLPAGNWDAGERGIAAISSREIEFKEGVSLAIEYARALKAKFVNCLVGVPPKTADPRVVRNTLVSNLKYAAELLGQEGVPLLIEPVNSLDVPNFYVDRIAEAVRIIEEVDHPNLFVLCDIYHVQRMEGNIIETIRLNLEKIKHIQIADVPGRHEPGTGEINFSNVFKFLDDVGYEGWVGCEYVPLRGTQDSLSWIKPYL